MNNFSNKAVKCVPYAGLLLLSQLLTACGDSSSSNSAAPANASPIADIQPSGEGGLAPFHVSLDGSGSTDSDGAIAGFHWDLGDGETATGSQIDYTYEAPGTYGITLTVTDDKGATGTEAVWVTVASQSDTFSLYGTVTASTELDADGDSNDPDAQTFNNNGETLSHIQPLVNPVVVSGYATRVPTGIEGDAFALDTDELDVYTAYLYEGDYVSLQMAESSADLDIYLLASESLDVVASSLGTGEFESLRVAADGHYNIMVRAAEGGSSYFLKLGSDSFVTGAMSVGQSGDFEPLQAIVQMDNGATGQVVDETQITLSHTSRTRENLARINPLNPQTKFRLELEHNNSFEQRVLRRNPRAAAKLQTLKAVKTLRSRPGVKSAELNYRVRPKLLPNDNLFPLQWNLSAMNLPEAWDMTVGTDDVVVAVVDSGVFSSHEDLLGQLVDGYDFISGSGSAMDGDGLDPDPTDPGDTGDITTSGWHGTHVIGAIAATMNNSVGMVGVAPGARVMPLRVLGRDGGSVYDVLQAVRYAAGLENDSGTVPAKPADVINLSLGGQGFSQAAQDLYHQVRAKGIFIVAASGNENSDMPVYPASFDGVISVAAYDYRGNRAPYSNRSPYVDVAAPGGDLAFDDNDDGYGDGILSLTVTESGGRAQGNYAFFQGTSIATPQVAGIIALMKSVYPELTPAQFDSLLINNAITHDMGTPGHDSSFGWGGIDAVLAVQAAIGLADGEQTAAIEASTTVLNFDQSTSTRTITLGRVGDGPLAITHAEFNQPWLDATEQVVDEHGFGSYQVSVDRSELSHGTYQGSVIFYTAQGSVLEIQVSLRVGDPLQTGNAGRVYVQLVDAETDLVIASTASNGINGEYPYRFDDISAGEYYLAAGNDVNMDSVLCQTGEFCGYFPTLLQRSVFTLLSNKGDMNFSVGVSTEPVTTTSLPRPKAQEF